MVKVINSSGKHKTATARATVTKGTGKVRINKIPLELYAPELVRMKISEPLLIAGDEVVSGLDINVDVRGGGIVGDGCGRSQFADHGEQDSFFFGHVRFEVVAKRHACAMEVDEFGVAGAVHAGDLGSERFDPR